MPYCRDCGRETTRGMRLCYTCLDKFKNRRIKAFEIAEKELGKLCADNHLALTKRVKQLEKKMKKDEEIR